MNYLERQNQLYTFPFEVTKLIDADTLEGSIDRGFRDKSKRRIRLARIDAWEMKGEEAVAGLRALSFVSGLIKLGDTVIIQTLGLDSFGRIVSEVFLPQGNLSDLLVGAGHAQYRTYKNLQKF